MAASDRVHAFAAFGLLVGGSTSAAACGFSDTVKGGKEASVPQSDSALSATDATSGEPSGDVTAGGPDSPAPSMVESGFLADDGAANNDAEDDRGADEGATSNDASGDDSGMDSEGGAACPTGQVQPSEVVMLGDSYLDPNWGNVGPTLMMDANAKYRPYYVGGASIDGGSGQFNIPYQFDSMAVPDNPDIKVVITDGGGNDLLLNNRQCLTTPVMGDMSCHMVIAAVVAKAQELMADMASKGVQHVVYFFYPHIDTTTIFTGPDANDWLDYAYPLAAQTCCGSSAPAPGAADSTCHGTPVPGMDCTFVDTRPEFVGHNDPNSPSTYWFDAFGIHPNKQGTPVLAQKVWRQMQKYCVAQ